MSIASEPVSNNQTILLGRTPGGSDIDLFVVNYDNKGNVSVDQIDFQQNGVCVNGADQMVVCMGSGVFVPSSVAINTVTVDATTITSSGGIMTGKQSNGETVSFRLAQITSIDAGDPGYVVFGYVNTESISSAAGDSPS